MLILMQEALSANFNVDIVSSIKSIVGETLAIRQVLVFPPRESYNSLVNLDSLKGKVQAYILKDGSFELRTENSLTKDSGDIVETSTYLHFSRN